MPSSLFKKIVDDLAEIGFTGRLSPHLYGEPLTDSRLISLSEYAHAKLPQATLRLYTNGDFLTPTLFSQLCDVGVCDYFITIHEGDANARKQSTERIAQLKKIAARNKKDVTLMWQTSTDINPYNRGGLIEINGQPPPPICLDPHNPLTINYHGDVLICCNDYLGLVTLGNLRHESLKNIWTKPEFVKLRRQLRRGVYRHDICKKCTGKLSVRDLPVVLRKRL